MDIANLKVGSNTYAIKDSTARTNARISSEHSKFS